MAFAACARQSAPSGLKGRSDLTIGCRDIEYLPIDRPRGESTLWRCVWRVRASGKKLKKRCDRRWPQFRENDNRGICHYIEYVCDARFRKSPFLKIRYRFLKIRYARFLKTRLKGCQNVRIFYFGPLFLIFWLRFSKIWFRFLKIWSGFLKIWTMYFFPIFENLVPIFKNLD